MARPRDDRSDDAEGLDGPELDAGDFGRWWRGLAAALAGEADSDVPCDGCTACCRSSQFVHIAPDELDTLAHIPHELRFPAPGRPGHVLLGYDEGTEAEDVLVERGSVGYQTFFAVNGVRYTPRFSSPEILDVPYLGTVLLEAAGLPLSDAYAGRKRLKLLCDGLWFDCPNRELILSFHRQLIDDGLVSAR